MMFMPPIENWEKMDTNNWKNRNYDGFVEIKEVNGRYRIHTDSPAGANTIVVEQSGAWTKVTLSNTAYDGLLDKRVLDRSEVESPSELARTLAVDYMRSHPRAGLVEDFDSMTTAL